VVVAAGVGLFLFFKNRSSKDQETSAPYHRMP
jgi:hypothetical protein